jgi:hypothetical protein
VIRRPLPKSSPYGRGPCSECGYEFNLKKDGTVRSHGDGVVFPPMNCSGSGRPPKVRAIDRVEGGE